MKPKKIPRCIRGYLLLLGFWIGNLTAIITFAIFKITNVGTFFIAIECLGSLCLFYIIALKYTKTLEEWDLIAPLKKGK